MTSRKNTQRPSTEHPFAAYVRILGKGKTGSRSLSQDEAYQAMSMILDGKVEDVQLGAFLMLLRVKEESHEELTGFASATKDHIKAPSNIPVDLDWSSYAGKKRQPPWFILSCLLLAEQGIRIYMHGAKGHTLGRIYTEDVLRELKLPIANSWQEASKQLDQSCFSFMPLQTLCPELQGIMDMRHLLGLRSPVHTLSRLLNPTNAKHSLQSIFHPSYASSHQEAAIDLGQPFACVFKGEGGEIERKPEATCTIKNVINGVASEEIWPKLIEGRQNHHEQLSAQQLQNAWNGSTQEQYATLAILGTTAIAIKLLGKASCQKSAFALAQRWWDKRNKSQLD